MKKISSILFLCLLALAVSAQPTQLDVLFNHYFPSDIHSGSGDTTGGSNCWGWTSPNGVDYAIFGTWYGTHYVRASDGLIIDSVPGAMLNDYYYHREFKTYRNYLYIAQEMTGAHAGIQIVDLSYLPDSVHLVGEYTYGSWPGTPRSHEIVVDTATGYVYPMAPDYSGLRIVSLANPTNPVDSGFITTGNIHDAYARNDTVWIAEGYNTTFSIWDVRIKSNPIKIGEITDPNFGYCHQIWPTDDGKHFITCEETAGKSVKFWDMTNINNIILVSEYHAPCSLAHNAHVMGDSVYISYYQSGVRILDISDLTNPVEVGYYDTYPAGDAGTFYGCWGTFPYSKNGYIYTSNIEGWMQILKFPASSSVESKPGKEISNAWPNPASDKIEFEFFSNGFQNKVEVWNAIGRKIITLPDTKMNSGKISGKWNLVGEDGKKVSAGIYFLKYGNEGKRIVIE